jgi:hypothetical protein
MKVLISNLLKRLSLEVNANIERDEYLEHAEREKAKHDSQTKIDTGMGIKKDNGTSDDSSGPDGESAKDKKINLTKDKEKKYTAPPKIKPPRREPSFKSKWKGPDGNETRKEYQRQYRLENGNK